MSALRQKHHLVEVHSLVALLHPLLVKVLRPLPHGDVVHVNLQRVRGRDTAALHTITAHFSPAWAQVRSHSGLAVRLSQLKKCDFSQLYKLNRRDTSVDNLVEKLLFAVQSLQMVLGMCSAVLLLL